MHILLIDDSSSTRSLLRTLINSGQSVRHDISEASSGEEALQKVELGEISLPDLVILDINMGGMSGFELCREFRQRYKTTSDMVPYIIIVTANEGVDVINQALESGANDYMPKPVNVKVLQVRLRVAERMLVMAQSGGNVAPVIPMEAPPTFIQQGMTPEEHKLAVDAAVAEALAKQRRELDVPVGLSPEEHQAAVDAAVADALAQHQPETVVQGISPEEHQAAIEAAVAEAMANGGGGAATLDPATLRDSQIGYAIDLADAPIALIDASGDEPSFQIVYANSAMTATTQFDSEQLLGKSLAELEAWTPEFLKMTLGYVQRHAILSHVPLWSKTRQAMPVHLSFYPIRTEDETLRQYLVIHHF